MLSVFCRSGVCLAGVLSLLGGTSDAASLDPIKVPLEAQAAANAVAVDTFASTAAPTGATLPGGPVFGTFDIVLNGIGGVSASLQAAFTDAESYWESFIQGYSTSAFSGVTQLVIDVTVAADDGPGGRLGFAGPNAFAFDVANELIVPTAGQMSFDSADATGLLTNGKWDDVIRHEMGHVIGLGTLWDALVTFGDGSTAVFNDVLNADGNYIGQFGLSTYNQEFGLNLSSILVEDDGGQGTAGGHWEEGTGGEVSAFPDRPGFLGADELMTGFINTSAGAPDPWLSETSIASYADIGYSVQLQSLPLPSGVWLMLSAMGVFAVPRLTSGRSSVGAVDRARAQA